MADILIPNIEMPKEKESFEVMLFHDGYITYRVYGHDEWISAKAIELPVHGDLVNLGDVYEAINREIVPKGIFLSDFYKAFANIPTVLERNYGTDN